MILLARDIARKIESDLEYPGQIKIHVIRESKAVEYARQLYNLSLFHNKLSDAY